MEKNVLKKLQNILEDKSIKKIGQNIKFDYIMLYHRGIDLEPLEDTMLMSYVLDAGKNRHNMDTLSEIHLGHKTISYKDLVGSGKKQINFSEVKIEVAKDYAAEDADITFRLYKKFLINLKNEKLMNIYETFEKPLIKILAHMEMHGIKLDKKFLNIFSKKNKKKFVLNAKNKKLIFVPPMYWCNVKFVKNNSVLMVVSDRKYETNDYIRNYNEYLRKVK